MIMKCTKQIRLPHCQAETKILCETQEIQEIHLSRIIYILVLLRRGNYFALSKGGFTCIIKYYLGYILDLALKLLIMIVCYAVILGAGTLGIHDPILPGEKPKSRAPCCNRSFALRQERDVVCVRIVFLKIVEINLNVESIINNN
ncbi:hypothetical protein ACJX0J_031655 [Zea mays]